MKHIPAVVAAATALTAFVSAPAVAEGFYVSGNIGLTSLGHTLERNEATSGLPVPDSAGISRVQSDDASVGLALGYHHNFTNNNFFVGGEAFYNHENASTRNIVGVLGTDINLNSSYGARLIGGVNVTPKFSLYGHVGYTQLDFDVHNSYTFAPPTRDAGFNEGGVSLGLGALYAVNDRVSLFADYTKVTDVNFNGLPEVAGGTGRVNANSLDLDRISYGVRVSF